MNQSHNENRCCFSGFKTLIASISCLVCLQALGDDCNNIIVTQPQLTCLGLLDSAYTTLQTQYKDKLDDNSNDNSSDTLSFNPDPDCNDPTTTSDAQKALQQFAAYCKQHCQSSYTSSAHFSGPNTSSNSSGDASSCKPGCAPTLTYSENGTTKSMGVTCGSVQQAIVKYQDTIEQQKTAKCHDLQTAINKAVSNETGTPSACPNGYLTKIWQKYCKQKSTAQLSYSTQSKQFGARSIRECSTKTCSNLGKIQSYADNLYCTLKKLQTQGKSHDVTATLTNVTRNDNTISVTVCGKTMKLNVTNFSSSLPNC